MTNIIPINKVKNIVISSFLIYRIDIILHKSVNLKVYLMNNNNPVDTADILIEGDDYANWGNDDDYITNYVANKLGFTIQDNSSNNA